MSLKAINHKKNPRKNIISDLELVSLESIFTEVSEEEKETILKYKNINNNIIKEDSGKDFE